MQRRVLLTLLCAAAAQRNAVKIELTEAATREGAVCLDGTPPAYYLLNGSGDGIKKWQLGPVKRTPGQVVGTIMRYYGGA
eukprot:Skav219146  [mRNA]  locus=scaffold1574:751128:751810:+ [translate_table: standard]